METFTRAFLCYSTDLSILLFKPLDKYKKVSNKRITVFNVSDAKHIYQQMFHFNLIRIFFSPHRTLTVSFNPTNERKIKNNFPSVKKCDVLMRSEVKKKSILPWGSFFSGAYAARLINMLLLELETGSSISVFTCNRSTTHEWISHRSFWTLNFYREFLTT